MRREGQKDKIIRKQILEICEAIYWNHKSYSQGALEILSLLDENAVGVSDSSAEHGGLPHVRKSEGEAKETDTRIGESEQITLGNRIDSENSCLFDNGICIGCGIDDGSYDLIGCLQE